MQRAKLMLLEQTELDGRTSAEKLGAPRGLFASGIAVSKGFESYSSLTLTVIVLG